MPDAGKPDKSAVMSGGYASFTLPVKGPVC